MTRFLLTISVLIAFTSEAWSSSTSFSSERIDARLIAEMEHIIPRISHVQGHNGALIPRSTSSTTPVMLKLTGPASSQDLDDLEQAGAKLHKTDEGIIFYKQFVPALIDRSSVEQLLELSIISHISAAPQAGPRPMHNSAELIGLDAAWGSRPSTDLLTGEGVKVVDIDGNADIFHPLFFKADAGYYDWIDVDKDGIFTPGVDAIDINADGEAADEIGELLASAPVELFTGKSIAAHIDGFDPGIDWIYIDVNADGERNYGAGDGFDDSAPALGEPLFVPDDVNQNGVIDVGERMVQLGTSKISKIFISVNHEDHPIDHIYERGVDFAEFDINLYNLDDLFLTAGHGSGVLSIIGGDNPLIGRRNVGTAPDAELRLVVDHNSGAGITWALSSGVDVVLWEVANWFMDPLDGTDTLSVMLDASSSDGNITHTCPVGNCGGSRKHTHYEFKTGETATFEMNIPNLNEYYYNYISISERGEGSLTLTLIPPAGSPKITMPSYNEKTFDLPDGAICWMGYRVSTKKTKFYEIVLFDDSHAGRIPSGTWTLEITEQGDGEVTMDGYLMDTVSSWGLGFAWEESIASDDRTIGMPAVSESCIAIGAHVGHPSTKEEPWFGGDDSQGEIRYYSGRGPTIDGRQKPDITAPDNPWAATPHIKEGSSPVPHGAVTPFGGTSGAGPHVAGVAALLAQVGIYGNDAKEAIGAGAHVDDLVGDVPNYDYGWGRLNAAGALGVDYSGAPPTVTITVPKDNAVGQPVLIQINADDPDSSTDLLEAKWDDNYDGTWDSEYAAITDKEITFDQEGEYVLKVRVRDETGRFAEALALVSVKVPTSEPIAPKKDDSDCGCSISGKSTPSLLSVISELIF